MTSILPFERPLHHAARRRLTEVVLMTIGDLWRLAGMAGTSPLPWLWSSRIPGDGEP
jgi:hypothetical protein